MISQTVMFWLGAAQTPGIPTVRGSKKFEVGIRWPILFFYGFDLLFLISCNLRNFLGSIELRVWSGTWNALRVRTCIRLYYSYVSRTHKIMSRKPFTSSFGEIWFFDLIALLYFTHSVCGRVARIRKKSRKLIQTKKLE